MKKMLLLIILLFTAAAISGSAAADTDPETLILEADSEYFSKAGFVQKFDKSQGYMNDLSGDEILHQFAVQNGAAVETLTALQPLETAVRAVNKLLQFMDYRAKVFHASISLQQEETIPEGSGRCWLLYSDAAVTGAGNESGVILYPGEKAYSFTKQKGEAVYNEIADLGGVDPSQKTKIDVIRLDGISYFYFDGSFAFRYEDGIPNPVSFEAGTQLNEGGNRIRCNFDDFTYRKQ